MPDDKEERRQQDQRDFEFYRRRLKPTAADLWRLIEGPENRPPVIAEPRVAREKTGESDHTCRTNRENAGMPITRAGESYADNADAVWPMVVALIVLIFLGLGGDIDKIPHALLF